ncbi:MAG: YfhO family protein [Leptolyngbya sp.]|nr:YfhO family protein [Candidatus Melainabacteria bacterium]
MWLVSNISHQAHLTLPGFDGTLPSSQAMTASITTGSIALVITGFTVTLALVFRKLPWSKILPVVFVLANVLSLANTTRQALAPTGAFRFRSTGAIDQIRKDGERMTAAGNYFFSPNIAMAYGLRDFRQTGALMPKRSNNFVRNATAQKITRNMSNSFFMTPLLDAASVKSVISRWPIYSSADKPLTYTALPGLAAAPQVVNSSASIISGKYCLSTEGEIFVHLVWLPSADDAMYYASELALVDSKGTVVAQGQRKQFGHGQVKGIEQDQFLAIKIPAVKKNAPDLTLVMRIYSVLTESVTPIDSSKLKSTFGGIELLKLESPETLTTDLSKARLKFISEDSEQILLYQNQNVMPQAYLTSNYEIVPDYEKACETLSNGTFNIAEKTVIENNDKEPLNKNALSSTAPIKAAIVERPNPNTVKIKAAADQDGILVLTDTFYPGWRAFVDGKETPIYAANTAFRAIQITKGKHDIVFSYSPLSYLIGKAISRACLGVILLVLIWRLVRKKKVVEIDA